jgi:hypothetical protein
MSLQDNGFQSVTYCHLLGSAADGRRMCDLEYRDGEREGRDVVVRGQVVDGEVGDGEVF